MCVPRCVFLTLLSYLLFLATHGCCSRHASGQGLADGRA